MAINLLISFGGFTSEEENEVKMRRNNTTQQGAGFYMLLNCDKKLESSSFLLSLFNLCLVVACSFHLHGQVKYFKMSELNAVDC